METLPGNPLERFWKIDAALEGGRGFWGDVASSRFAAWSSVMVPGEPEAVAEEFRSTAERIRERVGWFGDLRGPLRFVVSAMLVRADDSADAFLEEVKRVGNSFRELRLRRGGVYETLAVLILRQRAGLAPVPRDDARRFSALYEELKRYHRCLTARDDLLACAVLVHEAGTPREIGAGIERL